MYDALLPIPTVIAQIEVTPSNAGLPGAVFWQQVLGWLAWGGLAGSLASLLIGGAVWGLSHANGHSMGCLLYTSPSPRDQRGSRMPSSA